jgi:hypothetical protein
MKCARAVSQIHFLNTTNQQFGKPFLIREYHTGEILWELKDPKKRAKIMAENHARLLQLNSNPIIQAFARARIMHNSNIGVKF